MTPNYHSLLKRQLRRLLGDEAPPSDWKDLLANIDDAYRQFDRDRAMLERSMEISSQELQHANSDIRAVLEGLIDYYLRLDEAGTILYGRGLSVPALLTSRTSLTGKNIRDAVRPEVRTVVTDTLTRMRIDENLHVIECEADTDEEMKYYELRFVPAHNRQISLIIRDITETKNIARREQLLQQRLARAERIESLGILAAGVAHDLNNILSPLVTYPDILLDSIPADDPRHGMLMQMQKSVIRASAIIQDLLTLTRRGNNEAYPVDVGRIVNQYLQSADYAELKKAHPKTRIEEHVAAGLPELKGSAHQLTQTIMNLVTNACEAIGPDRDGRVSLSVQMEPREGDTETTDGRAVVIEVADTGCGIPKDELEHIFEPFFSRRKKERGGTGLGLSIVYGTVKDFGGTIRVESDIDKGTVFSIRLPAKSGLPAREPAESMELGETDHTPCRVMVVDDDENQRELCRAILGSRNYDVVTADSGRNAIAMLKLQDVDIVLLDMIMEEDCDGLRTYETIRTFKPEQKCIIVSGYAKTDNVRKALDLGVHSFVQKPYTLKTLQSAIQAALTSETPPRPA